MVLFDYAGQVAFNMFVKSWLNFTEEFLFHLVILILRSNICQVNVNAICLCANQNMLFFVKVICFKENQQDLENDPDLLLAR